MFNRLVGVVKETKEQAIVLEVGNFWFDLQAPSSAQWQIGERAEIFVQLHWHQEQGPSLYGFATLLEKQLFLLIIGCSGVGPKLALAILAQLGAASFVQAIQQEDDRALSKVSGVGPRKAEQLVMQLRHKIASIMAELPVMDDTKQNDWQLVSQTLESLRYSRLEIARAISHVRMAHTDGLVSFDQLVKSALGYLAKQP